MSIDLSKKLELLLASNLERKRDFFLALNRCWDCWKRLVRKDPTVYRDPQLLVAVFDSLVSLQGQLYEGFEHMLEDILKFFGEDLPSGGSYHRNLLRQAFWATRDRPPILPEELREGLEDARGFHHVARHRYTHCLKASKVLRESPARLRALEAALEALEGFERSLIRQIDPTLQEWWENKRGEVRKANVEDTVAVRDLKGEDIEWPEEDDGPGL